MTENESIELVLPDDSDGERLDKALAKLLPDLSRATIQKWLQLGRIRVNDQLAIRRQKCLAGQCVRIEPVMAEPVPWQAEDKPLDILYEDEALIVLNKAAGVVVHPGAGNPDGTLVNALLHHDPSIQTLPRAGIVHRIDKDTTGLLVVARQEKARLSLVDQLKDRSLKRRYLCVVQGELISGGEIDAPIGRHPADRRRMTVTEKGKPAQTEYRIERRFRHHTQLRVSIRSGRTHQIRVHMRHIGHPLVGDPVYGTRLKIPPSASTALIGVLQKFKRQALHAWALQLRHPLSGEIKKWQVSIPPDMQNLLTALETDRRQHTGP